MVDYKMSGIVLTIKHSGKKKVAIGEIVYRDLTFPVSKEENYGAGWLTVKTKVIEMG